MGETAPEVERMRPRLHIAGSASGDSEESLLAVAHELVADVVRRYAAAGGSFVLGIGAEPLHQNGTLPLVFDWTAFAAAEAAIRSGAAPPATQMGPLIVAGASQRGLDQVPDNRRPLLDALLEENALDVRVLPEGWRSGALIRAEQASAGDVLLTLGGGAGVEHLANLYGQSGRSIIPLDFAIGASRGDDVVGGAGLAARALRSPANFLRLRSGIPGAARLMSLSTRELDKPPEVLGDRIVRLIEELEPPLCFYVRLLDTSLPAFGPVERFFREIVDPVVGSLGFASFEMGRDEPEQAWMNEEIFARLYFSTMVIADLTELRPNCLAEVGYALGRAQRVVITARNGTRPPFDLDKIPWFFWDADEEAEALRDRLAAHLRLHSTRPPLVVVPPLV